MLDPFRSTQQTSRTEYPLDRLAAAIVRLTIYVALVGFFDEVLCANARTPSLANLSASSSRYDRTLGELHYSEGLRARVQEHPLFAGPGGGIRGFGSDLHAQICGVVQLS